MRWEDVEARHRGRTDHLVDVIGIDDDVVDTTAELAADDTEPAGGIALRVHVDDQPAEAELRKVGGHVDGGRGLADSALLVDDCVDSWQFAGCNGGRRCPDYTVARIKRTFAQVECLCITISPGSPRGRPRCCSRRASPCRAACCRSERAISRGRCPARKPRGWRR